MSWLKLDDAFFDHEKILDRSKDAKLLHLAALTYCAARSPYGVLSPTAIRVCAAKVEVTALQKVVGELLDAQLWEPVPPDSPVQPVPPGSYQIHDFTLYNPTPEQAEALRAARRSDERRHADALRQRHKRERDKAMTEPVTQTVTTHAMPSHACLPVAATPIPSPLPISQTSPPDDTPTPLPLWDDAETLTAGALLKRYRETFGPAGEPRLAAWLAAARTPVKSQAAYLRPCLLGWLRGEEPDPLAQPLSPTTPTRSLNAAAAAKAEALRAEFGTVGAALDLPRKETS